jgi:TatD DNase family protein
MIDSHCHLADEAFAGDVDAVIARARSAGVVGALCIGEVTDPAEIVRLDLVAAAWDGVRTTAGVHPHRASAQAGDVEAAVVDLVRRRVAVDPRVRAVGEIGLDYHYDFAPRERQREVFAAQVAYAVENGLPVVIHTREADADTLAVLREAGAGRVTGVFHCFSGDRALAIDALALGFYISFSGILTFPKAAAIRDAAIAVPLDRVLVETDCPYLAPVPHRGRRNEPAWVAEVVRVLASVHGLAPAEVAAATTENYRRLFRP